VIIGGLVVSVVLTVFVVPAAYLMMYQRRAESPASAAIEEAQS
jgi:Cu/Ag efflux pump CusA